MYTKKKTISNKRKNRNNSHRKKLLIRDVNVREYGQVMA